jgi:hypothetical protein
LLLADARPLPEIAALWQEAGLEFLGAGNLERGSGGSPDRKERYASCANM